MTGKWKPYRWSKSQVPEAENLITIKDIRNLGAVFSKKRQLFFFILTIVLFFCYIKIFMTVCIFTQCFSLLFIGEEIKTQIQKDFQFDSSQRGDPVNNPHLRFVLKWGLEGQESIVL